jgi:hypothetical protein
MKKMGTLEGAGSRCPEVRQREGVNSICNLPMGTKSTCLCSRLIGKLATSTPERCRSVQTNRISGRSRRRATERQINSPLWLLNQTNRRLFWGRP